MATELQMVQLRIGEWLVEPALDLISRDNETVKLEPRTMRLLMRLAESPAQLVTSQQLLDEVWPGVVVGSASLYQAISQLRKLLGDIDAAPTYIATVPRKGYRLIAPIGSAVQPQPLQQATTPAEVVPADVVPSEDKGRPRRTAKFTVRTAWAASLVLAALIATASVVVLRGGEHAVGEANSIVVLPFVDISAEQRDAALCDGLTEELSTSLALLPKLRVVARTSAYAFRDRPMDVREIGRQLAATHVLEGSVRRSGEFVRVTARLIDARRGYRSWSASYDVPMQDVVKLQSDIARSVADAMEIRFPEWASTRIAARSSDNARAVEQYLLGRHQFLLRTREANARAAELTQRAIALDPGFALAYVGLAQVRLNDFALAQRPVHELSQEVEQLLETGLKLDPELAEAYATRGALRRAQNRPEAAKEDLSRAIALNGNNLQAVVDLGRLYEQEGLPRQALAQFTHARELDPLDFMRYVDRCIALQDLGRYQEAEADCSESRRLQPASEWGFLATSWLARAQGRLADSLQWNDAALLAAPMSLEVHMQRMEELLNLGMLEEARATLRRATEIADGDPRVTIAYADLLLMERGEAEVRQFISGLRLDDAGAADLLEAAQISAAAGDYPRAAALAARAQNAPDFSAVEAAHRMSTKWGTSYELALSLIDVHMGNQQGRVRLHGLLQTLDELERNGSASWGLHALRASALAMLGDGDAAMLALQRAADAGWRKSWKVRHDPYLAALSGRDDFRALIAHVDRLNAIERERYLAARG